MSTIKVNKIENTSTTNGGVSIDVDGHVTIDGQQFPTAGPLSNRNLIVNGAMQVAQRSTSSSTSGIHSVDRWYGLLNLGAATHSQESTDLAHQPFTEDGLRNYFRLTNDTATTDAASFRGFATILESQDIANSGWDYTSSSSFVTFSFWVRSSVSQKFYGQLTSIDGTGQNYAFSFTPEADTWTKVVKTIPGDSNLQFDLDANAGLRLRVMAYWGSNFTDPAVSEDTWFTWTTGNRVPDMATTWTNTAGATFDLTGVQLEVGTKSTPYEHRSYSEELQRCQRYCQVLGGDSYKQLGGAMRATTTTAKGQLKLVTTMRATPTGSTVGSGSFRFQSGDDILSGDVDFTSLWTAGSDHNVIWADWAPGTGTFGGSAKDYGMLWCNNGATRKLILSAEL